MDGGNAINKILFLKARAMKKDAATLVASGPQGTVCSIIHQSSSISFFHWGDLHFQSNSWLAKTLRQTIPLIILIFNNDKKSTGSRDE